MLKLCVLGSGSSGNSIFVGSSTGGILIDAGLSGKETVRRLEEIETTFSSQSTFVLPLAGRQGAYIFMADRWEPRSLGNSSYVWLPLDISGRSLSLRWRDEWDLGVFD